MKRKNVARALVAAAAVPAFLMGTAGQSFADGNVTWHNGTGDWLGTIASGNNRGAVVTGLSGGGNSWHDQQNSDGSWNEVSNYLPGYCLTGYYRSVYTEPCNATKDGTNWWERWYEISTPTGWKLQNRETGYILDDDGNGNIYANVNDAGDGDRNQRWH